MPKVQVKAELKEIKYYNTHRNAMDKLNEAFGKSHGLQLVEKYNQAILEAPCQLLELYAEMYQFGKTLVAVAHSWAYSVDYLQKVHLKLIKYFEDYFKEVK